MRCAGARISGLRIKCFFRASAKSINLPTWRPDKRSRGVRHVRASATLSPQLSRIATLLEVGACEIPVDDIPECLDVFIACVAVVNVIRMLPYVAGEQRYFAMNDRAF